MRRQVGLEAEPGEITGSIDGIIMVVIGSSGLGSGPTSRTHDDAVVDVGPIQITADEEVRPNIPP